MRQRTRYLMVAAMFGWGGLLVVMGVGPSGWGVLLGAALLFILLRAGG